MKRLKASSFLITPYWNFVHQTRRPRARIDYGRHITRLKSPATQTFQKYPLLEYIVPNWLWHTTNLELEGGNSDSDASLRGRLFRMLVLEKQLLFDIRPWDSITKPSEEFKYTAQLGWALQSNHVLLLCTLMSHDAKFVPQRYLESAGHWFFTDDGQDAELKPQRYLKSARHWLFSNDGNAQTSADDVMIQPDVTEHMLVKVQTYSLGTMGPSNPPIGWIYTQILLAARQGHLEVLRKCLPPLTANAKDMFGNVQSKIYNHLLSEAAAFGQEAVVSYLCTAASPEFTVMNSEHALNAMERAALGGHHR